MKNIRHPDSGALLTLQSGTAVVTGTAGCAGTTLRREPWPPKTVQIICSTLTPWVSSFSQVFSYRIRGLLI